MMLVFKFSATCLHIQAQYRMLLEKVKRVHLQNVGEEMGFLQEGGSDLLNSMKFMILPLQIFIPVCWCVYRSIYVKMLEKEENSHNNKSLSTRFQKQ